MRTQRSEDTWRKIVAIYQGGDVRIPALAERFGLSHEAVRQGLKRRNAIQVRSQLKRKNTCGAGASSN
jgi:predicted ArsR family transcriptional regulator